jgi:hypothetical protein
MNMLLVDDLALLAVPETETVNLVGQAGLGHALAGAEVLERVLHGATLPDERAVRALIRGRFRTARNEAIARLVAAGSIVRVSKAGFFRGERYGVGPDGRRARLAVLVRDALRPRVADPPVRAALVGCLVQAGGLSGRVYAGDPDDEALQLRARALVRGEERPPALSAALIPVGGSAVLTVIGRAVWAEVQRAWDD